MYTVSSARLPTDMDGKDDRQLRGARENGSLGKNRGRVRSRDFGRRGAPLTEAGEATAADGDSVVDEGMCGLDRSLRQGGGDRREARDGR